jgi:hypothetical protein
LSCVGTADLKRKLAEDTVIGVFNNFFMLERAMKILTTFDGIQIFKPNEHTIEVKFKVQDNKELKQNVVNAIRSNKGHIEEDRERIKQIKKTASSGALDYPVYG